MSHARNSARLPPASARLRIVALGKQHSSEAVASSAPEPARVSAEQAQPALKLPRRGLTLVQRHGAPTASPHTFYRAVERLEQGSKAGKKRSAHPMSLAEARRIVEQVEAEIRERSERDRSQRYSSSLSKEAVCLPFPPQRNSFSKAVRKVSQVFGL